MCEWLRKLYVATNVYIYKCILYISMHISVSIYIYTRMYMPMGSMHGIFTYICHTDKLYVGKYTIHGSYGILPCK